MKPAGRSADRGGNGVGRRRFLRDAAAAAALTGAAVRGASAEDAALDALMGDNGNGRFGQDFDQA